MYVNSMYQLPKDDLPMVCRQSKTKNTTGCLSCAKWKSHTLFLSPLSYFSTFHQSRDVRLTLSAVFTLTTLSRASLQACVLDRTMWCQTIWEERLYLAYSLSSLTLVIPWTVLVPNTPIFANTCALITAQMCLDLPSAYTMVTPGICLVKVCPV